MLLHWMISVADNFLHGHGKPMRFPTCLWPKCFLQIIFHLCMSCVELVLVFHFKKSLTCIMNPFSLEFKKKNYLWWKNSPVILCLHWQDQLRPRITICKQLSWFRCQDGTHSQREARAQDWQFDKPLQKWQRRWQESRLFCFISNSLDMQLVNILYRSK